MSMNVQEEHHEEEPAMSGPDPDFHRCRIP